MSGVVLESSNSIWKPTNPSKGKKFTHTNNNLNNINNLNHSNKFNITLKNSFANLMPAQSHADVLQDPLKSSHILPYSLPTETDYFDAAYASSSHPLGRDTACIGKHYKEKENVADRQGIRPGTLLRGPENLKIDLSDCINKIHNNNIPQKQNDSQNIKLHKSESDELQEKRAEEANINKSIKFSIKILNEILIGN